MKDAKTITEFVKNVCFHYSICYSAYFFDYDENGKMVTLFQPHEVKILRHKKIKATANPFATEDSKYFADRKENGTIGCRVSSSLKSCGRMLRNQCLIKA